MGGSPIGWQLEVRDEEGGVRRLPLGSGELVIGRADDADLQLDRQAVSRRHAKLTRDPTGRWHVEDLGSRGGTLVNGEPVQRARLRDGDVVGISRYELRLLPPHATARPAPPPDDPADISVLSQIAPPKLDLGHVSAVNELGRQLAEIDSPAERLQRLCALVCGDVIRGRWALALRLDGDDVSRPPVRLAAFPADRAAAGDVHISRSTIRAMQAARAPVLASNFGKDGSGVVELSMVRQAPATAVVACPLDDDPAARELLYVNLPPVFGSPEWLALIALATTQYRQAEAAANAREAVRLRAAHERDLVNARQIQRSILPAAVEAPGLDVAWSYRPCEMVGGDIVDAAPMADGRWLLTIADVTGHGLPAALAALGVHSTIHACLRNGVPLLGLMRTLNGHLCRFLPGGRFVTMLAVAVDPATGELEYVNAGHHAPLVFTSGAARKLHESAHLPLGLQEEDYAPQADRLAPGETLFLSTDGIREMRTTTGEMIGDGIEPIIHTLAPSATPRLTDIAAALTAQLDTLRAGPALDDETFLFARRNAP